MYDCLITFRSVTPAQRGEKALRKVGIDCQLSRTPRPMEEQGCGYSLRLNGMQLPRALEILRQKGIAYRKAYRIADGVTPEEIPV